MASPGRKPTTRKSATRDFLFRKFFQLRVHESSGDAFQNLFSQVMKYADARFQSIKPWGDWGDGGNDGWIEEDGHYFQVYGPKPTTKDKESVALNKAIGDFDKLPDKWKNVRRYSFVMNDRFDGIPAPIASALQKLKIDKGLEQAKAMEMKDLLNVFMGLADDERQDVVWGIPDTELDFVDARAVGELLSSLADRADAKLSFLNESAPDFDSKIVFNNLTPCVGSRLKSASYQLPLVDDFLTGRDAGLRQAIAQEIRAYYQQSKTAIPDTTEDASDMRYFWMTERLIPSQALSHPHSLGAYRQAAELVLAKYFETCDAYEHPDSTNSA